MRQRGYGSEEDNPTRETLELYTCKDPLSANSYNRPLEGILSSQEDAESFIQALVNTGYNTQGVIEGIYEQLGIVYNSQDATTTVEGYRTVKINNINYLRIPSGIISIKGNRDLNQKSFIAINKPDPDFAQRRIAKLIGLDINNQFNDVKIYQNKEGKYYLNITTNAITGSSTKRFPLNENEFLNGEELIPRFAESVKTQITIPQSLYYKYNCLETCVSLESLADGVYKLYYNISNDLSNNINTDLGKRFFILESAETVEPFTAVELLTLNVAAGNVTSVMPLIKLVKEDSVRDQDFNNVDIQSLKADNADIKNLNVSNKTNLKATSIVGETDLTGDLTINGNIYQNGESFITHAEDVKIADNEFTLRSGAAAGLSANEYSGIIVENYNGGKKSLKLVVDKDGEARLGEDNQLQPFLTREEEERMKSFSPIIWNGANRRAETINMPETGMDRKVLVYKGLKEPPEFELFKETATWTGTKARFEEIIDKNIVDPEDPDFLDDGCIVNIIDDGQTIETANTAEMGNYNPMSSEGTFKFVNSSITNSNDKFKQVIFDIMFPVNNSVVPQYPGEATPNAKWGNSNGIKSKWVELTTVSGYEGLNNRYLKISNGAVNTLEAESLPNIEGDFNGYLCNQDVGYMQTVEVKNISNNAMYNKGKWSPGWYTNTGTHSWSGEANVIGFDANKSNTTYQDNAKVNPDNVSFKLWKRVE